MQTTSRQALWKHVWAVLVQSVPEVVSGPVPVALHLRNVSPSQTGSPGVHETVLHVGGSAESSQTWPAVHVV
jgi:hypothetical protein